MNDLKHNILNGLSWSFKTQLVTQIINFIVGILLMRLLSPDEFGKFAMVLIVVSFLQIFSNLSLSSAIIQRKEPTNLYLSTAFWFQFSIALSIAGLLMIFGTLFNSFYHEVILDQIAFWLGIDFFIGALGIIPIALLQKRLKFKTLFKIQLTALFISSFVGIIMALTGLSIFSLVGKMITWTSINSIGAFIATRWQPNFKFSFTSLSTLLKYGIPATGNQILNYLVRNSDDLFIGRVIGSASLGLYNRAYMLMLLPMANITSVISTVLFPSWSKLQDDVPQIKRVLIKILGTIAFITFPIMTLLSFLSKPTILFIFGEQWIKMSTVLSILCMIGMLQSVGALVGLIYKVFDKNKLLFKINFIISTIMILVIIGSVYLFKSIEVTAFCYAITSFVAGFPSFYYAGKIINASFTELVQPLIRPLIISLFIGILGWTIFKTLPINIDFIKLFLSGIFALIVYFYLSLKFNNQVINDLSNVIGRYKSGLDA